MGDLLTVNGTDQPIYSPTELLFDPRRGMSFRQRVSCPGNQAPLLTIINQVQPLGASGQMTFAGDDPTLEYELPGIPSNLVGVLSELFADQWDLAANESTDTIFANPFIISNTDTARLLNYNDRVVLSRLARDGGLVTDATDSCNTDLADGGLVAPTAMNGGAGNRFQVPGADASQPDRNLAKQLLKELLKGQTEYEKPFEVLSHVSACSPTSTYNTARANKMKIYTPAQLLAEVGSGWTINLPNRLISEISAITPEVAPPDESDYYTWGWLKKITRSALQTNFTIEVSTEYILGLWSNIRYGLAT